MIPGDFDYYLFGTHVRFGDGVANALGSELAAMELRRPVVLTQDRIAATPGYAGMMRSLKGMDIAERRGIPPHSSVSLIETIAPEVIAFRADCLVAVGGGSVADTAKALALLVAEGGRLADHVTRFEPPHTVHIPRRTRPKLPVIAVPTTASGAETTSSFGVRDDGGDKRMFWNRQVSSTSILIDPLMSGEVPQDMLRETAMNGLAHCVEGLYSKGRSVVSDALAMQAIALLRQAWESGHPAAERRLILAAAHLSGMVLAMARSCLHHAICHVIGARLNLPHGKVNTIILPHAIRFNESAAASMLAPVVAAIPEAESLSAWIARTAERLAMPRRLRDLGVPEAALPDIAGRVMTERGLAFNPRPVADAGEVLAILRQAF
ncbi:iron-containing alcohol dehydrogenase family protein [Bordetella genomosp. 9]|uniref:Iron-containing alcohol dehydrogenase n=1 Tax=Bordetella genomosp. 9 TaxID=1416803 RepID=A0A1W6YUL7_9BORD|nr:iron-containing alcohol dehydrogenase [Bordetella genomosp. 9]ARP84790.1 iron-containing alcohol dehydrogenase [Bordetella genomosp. 9]